MSAINTMDCGRKSANDLCRQLHMQPAAAATLVAPAVATPQQRSISSFFLPASGPDTQQQQQPAQLQPNSRQPRPQPRQPHVGQRQQLATGVPVSPPDGQRRITELLHPATLSEAEQQQLLQRQQHRLQLRIQMEQQQAVQRQLARQHPLVQAKQQAVAKFWQLLADFVILNPCPGPTFAMLPHDHPFMCIQADDRLCLSPRPTS